MKKYILTLSLILMSLTALTQTAHAQLSGVYANNDGASLLDSITLCNDGKAYAAMGRRSYTVEKKDGKEYLVLESNGTYRFTIDNDGKTLTPADQFTKEWGSASTFTLTNTEAVCNW